MFLYLSKLFSDFLQFEGNLIHEQNNVTTSNNALNHPYFPTRTLLSIRFVYAWGTPRWRIVTVAKLLVTWVKPSNLKIILSVRYKHAWFKHFSCKKINLLFINHSLHLYFPVSLLSAFKEREWEDSGTKINWY